MSARSNFVFDAIMATAFLLLANPPSTGLVVHEWLGVLLAAAGLVHVLVHWNWIARTARRVWSADGRGQRLNAVVNAVLFVALTAVVLSGVLTSKHLSPALGFRPTPNGAWRGIHALASNVLIAGLGVHVGLHWSWIDTLLGRLIGRRNPVGPPAVGAGRGSMATTYVSTAITFGGRPSC